MDRPARPHALQSRRPDRPASIRADRPSMCRCPSRSRRTCQLPRKGRKQRITPLTSGLVSTLRVWLAERGGPPGAPLFVTRSGKALSRDALEHRLAKYVQMAGGVCPTLTQKSVTMHVLRHSAAMRLLHAGIDTSVIALWLGHENVETTQVYLHADLAIK